MTHLLIGISVLVKSFNSRFNIAVAFSERAIFVVVGFQTCCDVPWALVVAPECPSRTFLIENLRLNLIIKEKMILTLVNSDLQQHIDLGHHYA